MTQTYKVAFEKPAVYSLEDIQEYLTYHSDCRYAEDPSYAASESVETLIDKIEERLSISPLSNPVSPRLRKIGKTDYRELLISPYRVWFRAYSSSQEVSVYMVAHQRQDLERLLIDYCLIEL